jgi:hypothetical protein
MKAYPHEKLVTVSLGASLKMGCLNWYLAFLSCETSIFRRLFRINLYELPIGDLIYLHIKLFKFRMTKIVKQLYYSYHELA